MRIAALPATSMLIVGFSAAGAQAATPTVTPAVVRAPGTVEARFVFTGIDEDASVTVAPGAVGLAADGYSDAIETVKITSARVEGGGTLTPSPAIAAESVACRRGGVFPNDPRTYRLDVPAKTTVTVVVAADVPLGLPGRAAGVTLTHGALRGPGGITTSEDIVETAPIQRTGYVDGLSLKASGRKAGKVTFTGKLIPARSGAKVTLVSRAVPEPGGTFDLVGRALFSDPASTMSPRKGLKVIGSTRTTKGGKYRVTLKVPVNVGVAARTAGMHAGSSCGVLGQREAVAAG